MAPLALHLDRVDKGETYIQCLVLEAGLYQIYEREEKKEGKKKKNKMMNQDIKRRGGGGEAQSVMLLCT